MHFQFLIEDQSSAVLIELLMEKIKQECAGPLSVEIKAFHGIGGFTKKNTVKETKTGKLLNDLATYLSGFDKKLQWTESAAIFVIVDNDTRETDAFHKELEDIARNKNIRTDHVFCIAVEEVEAWLLGDRDALLQAYPHAKKQILNAYQQDSICGTWECLADTVYRGGRDRLKKDCPTVTERGKCKSAWAMNIGKHMQLDANISPSFKYFLSEVRKRLPLAE